MKKLIAIVALLSLVAVTGAFAAPADSEKGDAQSYTAIVPSMTAIAEWVADYTDLYIEKGIYEAFAKTYEEGEVSVGDIFDVSLAAKEMEGLNPQNLIAAAFCAGAKYQEISTASVDAGFSKMLLVAGYKTAMTVCGDIVTDVQAFDIGSAHMAGPPGGPSTGFGFGSADGFPPSN